VDRLEIGGHGRSLPGSPSTCVPGPARPWWLHGHSPVRGRV